MSKLGDTFGMMGGGDEAPASEMSPGDAGDKEEGEKPKGGSAEVLAMKQFSRATDPEAKVQAFRDLLEAMGVC